MKIDHLLRPFVIAANPIRKAFLASLLLAAFASISSAAILVQINVSDSPAVVFTATPWFSAVDDISNIGAGVTFKDFFTGAGTLVTLTGLDAPDLSVSLPEGAAAYDAIGNGFGSGLSLNDLNIYVRDIVGVQSFSVSSPAFVGQTVTETLSSSSAFFPAFGTTGNIIVGNGTDGSRAVIGEWVVIPEPGTAGLAFLGMAALFFRHRRGIL